MCSTLHGEGPPVIILDATNFNLRLHEMGRELPTMQANKAEEFHGSVTFTPFEASAAHVKQVVHEPMSASQKAIVAADDAAGMAAGTAEVVIIVKTEDMDELTDMKDVVETDFSKLDIGGKPSTELKTAFEGRPSTAVASGPIVEGLEEDYGFDDKEGPDWPEWSPCSGRDVQLTPEGPSLDLGFQGWSDGVPGWLAQPPGHEEPPCESGVQLTPEDPSLDLGRR